MNTAPATTPTTAGATPGEMATVEMVKEKDCSGSVRYKAAPGGGPPALSTIYVNRTAFNKMPNAIKVQITAVA